MRVEKTYVLESERLGFRNWLESDLEAMTQINADPRVMEFFPSIQNREQTAAFIERMQQHYQKTGYCYFAVEEKHSGELIGFIGLLFRDNVPDIAPGVDIGWRLATQHWNKGYALEGAKTCLAYGFDILNLDHVISIAPVVNLRSEKIMKRLGLVKRGEFKHPELKQHPVLETCVLYEITADQWKQTL